MEDIFKIAQWHALQEESNQLELSHIKEAVGHVEFLDKDALKLLEKLLGMSIEVRSLYCTKDAWNVTYYNDEFPMSQEVESIEEALLGEEGRSEYIRKYSYYKEISFVDDEISCDKKAKGNEILVALAQCRYGKGLFVACLEEALSEDKKQKILLEMSDNLYDNMSADIPSSSYMKYHLDHNGEVCKTLLAMGVKDLYHRKKNKDIYFFIKDGEVSRFPIRHEY